MAREALDLVHHIGGHEGRDVQVFEHRSPGAPGDLVVRLPDATNALVGEAVATARKAGTELAHLGPELRARALSAVAVELRAQSRALSSLLARETGETIAAAAHEVREAASVFYHFAAHVTEGTSHHDPDQAPLRGGNNGPDVVALISSCFHPLGIPAARIAAAVACGDTVVWKPSEHASATAGALMRILASCGLPAGAVNLVLGASEAGASLVRAKPDIISFTGAPETRHLLQLNASRRGVRVEEPAGFGNWLVVLKDSNLHNAVDCAVAGAFLAGGHQCVATSRIIVDTAVANAFASELRQRVDVLKAGDPMSSTTELGPLPSSRHKASAEQRIAHLEGLGLTPLVGGSSDLHEDCFVRPTLFDGVPWEEASVPEIVGPVARIFRTNGLDSALRLIQQGEAPLTATLCTRSRRFLETFQRSVDARKILVNVPATGVHCYGSLEGIGGGTRSGGNQALPAGANYVTAETRLHAPV